MAMGDCFSRWPISGDSRSLHEQQRVAYREFLRSPSVASERQLNKCCQRNANRGVLDGNGLMSAEEQSDDSKHEQK
jgi:hypothetical protein